ncbi:MupA/Atu3671 family FMN-dependent luciferase-like monooxygenase [Micromonospora sp. NPDC003197]
MSSATPDRPPAISYGGDLPVDPEHPLTMPAALLRAADRFPDSGVHLVGPTGERGHLSYPDLLTQARAVLGGLHRRDVRAGQYVVLRLSDAEFFPAFWGCLLGGIVPVVTGAPPSYEIDGPALRAISHTWQALGRPMVIGGADDLDGLRELPLADDAVAVAELAAARPVDPPTLDITPDSVAMLQLSSGSTGTPKIIQITHRGVSEYAVGARTMLDVQPSDVLLNWLPLDHVAGLMLYHLGGVFLGATSIQVETPFVLTDPLRWLDLMQEYRVTHSWAPNFAFRLVADAAGRATDQATDRAAGRSWDLRTIRRLVSGGEQCTWETFQAFLDVTAPAGVTAAALSPAWGMSETCTGITFASLGDPGNWQRVRTSSLTGDLQWAEEHEEDVTTFLSVGAPAPGATLRIVDEASQVLPEARIGRLQVRSARVTPGYLGDPDATRAAFPEPGWLDTGDLAFMIDGRITITGREKDLIILNGHNYPSHEVERIMVGTAGIVPGLVAACGVPDPHTGTETLVIFYVPDATEPIEPGQVERHVAAIVGQRLHVAVGDVVAVPESEFPRTSGGKIQRALLRQRYLAGAYRPDPVAAKSDPDGSALSPAAGAGIRQDVRQLVLDAVGEIVGEPVDPTRPFYELGLGSVQIVRLRARLAQVLGRDIPQPALFAHPTVESLAHFLAGAESTAQESTSTPGQPADGQKTPVADRRIAIIGMAARLPGAATVAEYWANLTAGVASLRRFSPDELAAAGVPEATIRDADFVPVSGALDDVAGFDAAHFGISAREAELLDPQHRLFLETCHHALEDAGYAGSGDDARIGLFAGSGMNLYSHHTYLRNNLAAASGSTDQATSIGVALGNQPDFLATRAAYRLGLTGPAVNVQTACSTSLVAVHLAVLSLLNDDADIAIAGAAAVHVPQVTGYRHTEGSVLSRQGQCRPFDADADGTVGGNGVAAVVLKRLDRALADGDTIHAVVLGTAVNNDGAGKVGFTAPGVAGQVDVVRRALRTAGVPADSIGYVEAHGTGTALGDPIEHQALAQAYSTGTRYLGSVKANIGHLDSCAGLAGLLKAVLAVRTGQIPAQLNFDRPHPAIDLTSGPFRIATTLTAWPANGTPRRAGVSALGVGGTNAHVIVEEPPTPAADPPGTAGAPGLLPLSATDPAALRQLAEAYRDQLAGQDPPRPADLVVTAARGRRHLRHRLVVLGDSPAELATALGAFVVDGAAEGGLGGRPPTGAMLTGEVPTQGVGTLAMAFPGQGGTLRPLLALAERFDVVGELLAQTAASYHQAVGGDLYEQLADTGPDGPPTEVSQPALVALGIGLHRLWHTWGVRPAYLLGHSVGELAALAAAGALSAVDAIRLASHRGRLMRDGMAPGAMLAVAADRSTLDRLLDAVPDLELAAVNSPTRYVVAGAPETVAAALRQVDLLGATSRRLAVTRAFHTSAVKKVLTEFRELVAEIDIRPIESPFISTLDGVLREPGWLPNADHLCRQAREPVRFDAALRRLAEVKVRLVVEAGPDATLTGLARTTTPGVTWQPSQPAGQPPVAGLWRALGALYCVGAPIDWATVTEGSGGRRVPLPTYPFQRRRHWISGQPDTAARTTGDDPTVNDVLEQVRAMTATRLGVELSEITPDETFLGLGADSLLLLTMSREVDREFGIRVPIRDLFGGLNTPRRLAEAIAAAAAVPAPAAPATTVPVPAAPAGTPADGTAVGATPADRTVAGGTTPALTDIVHRQLDLMRQQLDLLAGATPPAPVESAAPASPQPTSVKPEKATPPEVTAEPEAETTDFSLYFFGDYPASADQDRYRLILDAAEYADTHDFHAVWFPERHFHSFGGIFPNPSVLAAAIAARTERIRLNAGSVVLPLHHPVRVAEEWSMVDNLSGGRVGLGCAPGWHANDFVFYPENFGKHKQVMYEHLATVQQLWRGEPVPARSGSGEQIEVRLFPRPVQEMPPFFTAIVGNPDSYREAARRDIGVVTNLMTQDVAQLAKNIALYRRTRAEHGLDPAGGRVTVLLHTYLGPDTDEVRRQAFEPFCAYLRSSFSLLGQVTNSLGINIDLANTPEDDLRFLLAQAYERYCEQRALIGSPESSQEVVRAVLDAGADEIACFVDFGVPPEAVRAGLPFIDALRRSTPRRHDTTGRRAAVPLRDTTGRRSTPRGHDTMGDGQAPPEAGPAQPEVAPLSPAQRRLWLVEQMQPGTPAYNEAAATRLDGALDVPALRAALRDVVDRHAPLRTSYRLVDGEPMQVVHREMAVECPVVDRTGWAEQDAVRQALDEESQRRFDLVAGPPFAFRLLRFSATHHVLVTSFHHLATDGHSYGVFTRDLSACYRARSAGHAPALPPLPVTYPELARGRRIDAEQRAADLRYWRERLTPPAPTLMLPTALPRPTAPSAAGRSLFETIPPALTTEVNRFSRTAGVTVFSTLMAAFAVMLGRASGERDFVLGTGVTSRDEQATDLIGFFVDTVPLRCDLTGDPTFAELATRVQRSVVDGLPYTGLPFDDLVRELDPPREPGRHPLFDVAVEYESGGAFAYDLPGVTATPLPQGLAKAPVDLMVYLSHGEQIRCHVEFRTEVFDEATVRGFLTDFHRVLERATVDPALSLSRLAPAAGTDGDAGLSTTEQLVHDAWCAELGVSRVPVDQAFFTVGGHSLASVRLANRLSELFGTAVPVHRLLTATGIRDLATMLATDELAAHTGSQPPVDDKDRPTEDKDRPVDAGDRPVEDEAPATYQQEQMWWRQRQVPDPPAVHIALRVDLTGRLSVPALTTALDTLVRRHPALRTRLVERDGTLVQQVLAHRPVTVAVSTVAPDDVEAWAVATGRMPFVDGEPLLRATLAQARANQAQAGTDQAGTDQLSLLVVIHHLAADGWSVLRLLDELAETYAATLAGRSPALAPLPASYAGYARQQRGMLPEEGVRKYWRGQLADAPARLELPTDRPRPAGSQAGAEFTFTVPATLTDRLTELTRDTKTTLFPVFASAYAMLLSRLTGGDDIVLASPYAHRAGTEHEPVVGLFASPMLLRIRPTSDLTFATLVADTDATILDAVRHQPAPVTVVHQELDPRWRPGQPSPVGTALFTWNPGLPELSLPDLVARVVDQPLACARRDFALMLNPAGDEVSGVVEYASDLFEESTVADWCDRFIRLLDAVSEDPHRRLDAY